MIPHGLTCSACGEIFNDPEEAVRHDCPEAPGGDE